MKGGCCFGLKPASLNHRGDRRSVGILSDSRCGSNIQILTDEQGNNQLKRVKTGYVSDCCRNIPIFIPHIRAHGPIYLPGHTDVGSAGRSCPGHIHHGLQECSGPHLLSDPPQKPGGCDPVSNPLQKPGRSEGRHHLRDDTPIPSRLDRLLDPLRIASGLCGVFHGLSLAGGGGFYTDEGGKH